MSALSDRISVAAKPLAGSPNDYDALMEMVGEARFVLLGEASHGTHEFYRERALITKRLIYQRGFNAVAVEADWPDAYRVNRYVHGESADLDSVEALSGFRRFPQWMWRNADVLDFVGWLREHNDEQPFANRKAGFYGLDLYSLHASIEAVLDYLDKVDPEAAGRAREHYGCFEHFGKEVQTYGYATGLGLAPTCEDAVVRELVALRRKEIDYLQRDGEVAADAYFCAQQNAVIVRNAEEYYRNMFRREVSSWNLRDTHMMETLVSLEQHLSKLQGTPAKIVVWAHNSHLGDARATQMGDRGELNLGQLVRERFAIEAVSIGFTTYTGSVTAASDWDAPAERKNVRPAYRESYEGLFHEVDTPRFFLNLRDNERLAAQLRAERLERAIGVIYRPETEMQSHYFQARLPDQFDGIIHFDHSRAVEPLERSTEWELGEVEETFPERPVNDRSSGTDDLFAAAPDSALGSLGTTAAGLTSDQACERLARFGANQLRARKHASGLVLLLRQFTSPIILILIGAAVLSIFLRDVTDAAIILTIVLVSGLLGFWQERGAATAVAKLSDIVAAKVRVLRDGGETLVAREEIVPGDIIMLSAGAIIPADCRLLEARDLFVNEAALTGETFPAEKAPSALSSATPMARRSNAIFMGTHVVSGTGKACVIHTGRSAEFGKIYETLRLRAPETEFEHGIRRFGYLLAEVTFVLVLAIFAFNVYFHKPVLDSLLFALALAVGLTPQLLPAIISINLAHGARRMAAQKVIVKRLAAIENFGSMNVLCSDKTGTLTEGEVRVHAALDPLGKSSASVLLYAYLNAANETGFINPIDRAIREAPVAEADGWEKLDEIPYDFLRKRLSVLVRKDSRPLLITKGALHQTLEVCARAQLSDGSLVALDTVRPEVERHWREFSHEGHRVLGVAYREMPNRTAITRAHESEMIFTGFVVLSDPPKAGIRATIDELHQLGIALKVITGDNALIAEHIAHEVGLGEARVLTGPEMREMTTQALIRRVSKIDVFAEIEPMQKERIILALKKAGHVVGYLGDGINDAPALHAADVGLSVDSAVDVAREAADFVLLEHDLEVLVDGVREGRRTFSNTLKYVFIATSANFGNMFSMAGASLFLPFLPLLPKQILLINLLTDFPEMTIAGDNVDPEMVQAPRRWDIHFIRRFMLVFGLISSVFDYLTFGVLFWLHANVAQFRTGWFIESIISAALIVLVVRSRRPFFKSRPSKLLALATLAIVSVTAVTPYLPLAGVLGFQPLPMYFYLVLGLVVMGYVVTAELAKSLFYRHEKGARTGGNL